MPIAALSQFWQNARQWRSDAVGLTQAGRSGPRTDSRPMATITTASAAIASGVIERLAGSLATADAALKAAEAECDRIKALIVSEMIAADTTSERTCWGLITLQSREKVTYSPAIKVLEIQLKAEKDKEVATGTAQVSSGNPFIRAYWAK